MECTMCSNERPHFMEPCPQCGNKTTFASHADRGLALCVGCQDKFCTDCKFGSRYLCKYMEQVNGENYVPPPPKLERQITEFKWEMAEEYMLHHPELTEYTVYQIRDTIYKIIRRGGYLIRKQSSEHCVQCGTVDIRYPEHREVYDTRGFVCGKCLSSQ